MSIIVHVAETAFISILVSAIESFPSKYQRRKKPKNALPEGEVYGLLFGQKIRKNGNIVHNVTIATPMHILTSKTPDEVTPSIKHFERIKTILESYPMYQFLGTFHSHPYPKSEYTGINSSNKSPTDQETALNDAVELGEEIIEVIVGLTYFDRQPKKSAPDIRWAVTQSYCGKYKYSIAAYITNTKDQELERVDNMICPLAAGVGNYDLN